MSRIFVGISTGTLTQIYMEMGKINYNWQFFVVMLYMLIYQRVTNKMI